MHIAGVLVRTNPEHVSSVRSGLTAIDGLEVHATTENGQLIVTIEGQQRQHIADSLLQLNSLPHVLAASLVYEQSESENLTGDADNENHTT